MTFKVLVYGATGLVGKHVVKALKSWRDTEVVRSSCRLSKHGIPEYSRELDAVRPDGLVIAAGLTGRPNVDWCEDHKDLVYVINVEATLDLITCCKARGVPVVFFSTGCIYDYGDNPERASFTENDLPNFTGSFYSWSKSKLEDLLLEQGLLDLVLVCRLRMPIQQDHDPRNLLDKLLNYRNIVSDRPNSMSVLEEIVPTCLKLGLEHRCFGYLNAVNPEPLTHKEIVGLYTEIVNPFHRDSNFVTSDDITVRALKGRRSNCKLATRKIEALCTKYGLEKPSSLSQAIRNIFAGWKLDKVCIITGAAGFIGSHVLEKFLSEPPSEIDSYIVVDNLSYAGSRNNMYDAVRSARFEPVVEIVEDGECLELIGYNRTTGVRVYFANIDISDDTQVHKLDTLIFKRTTSKVKLIAHFAAQTHVDRSFRNSTTFTKTNVLGTHNLLEFALRHDKPLFLHVSTDEVHGTVDDDILLRTSEPYAILDPTNPYAATKAAAEMLVRSYGHSYKIPYVITRCNNVYGPRQFPEKLVPTAIDRWSKGLPLEVHGDGTSKRHFLYVKDAADAFHRIANYMLGTKDTGVVVQKVVMISGLVHEFSVNEVVESLKTVPELASMKKEVVHVSDRPFNDVRYYSARDDFLWDVLGWKPEVDWMTGLRKTVRSYVPACDDD